MDRFVFLINYFACTWNDWVAWLFPYTYMHFREVIHYLRGN